MERGTIANERYFDKQMASSLRSYQRMDPHENLHHLLCCRLLLMLSSSCPLVLTHSLHVNHRIDRQVCHFDCLDSVMAAMTAILLRYEDGAAGSYESDMDKLKRVSCFIIPTTIVWTPFCFYTE